MELKYRDVNVIIKTDRKLSTFNIDIFLSFDVDIFINE